MKLNSNIPVPYLYVRTHLGSSLAWFRQLPPSDRREQQRGQQGQGGLHDPSRHGFWLGLIRIDPRYTPPDPFTIPALWSLSV